MTQPANHFDRFRRALTRRVGKERYELWFDAGVRFDRQGAQLLVRADSQFKLDRIRSQFSDDFRSAFQEVFGSEASLVFEIYACDSETVGPTNDTNDEPPTAKCSASASAQVDRSDQDPPGPRLFAPSPNRYGRRQFAQLESFVVGDGNRLAHAAVTMALKRPGAASPLFFYGPSGTGKTHLLEGLFSAGRKLAQLKRVVFLSAEQFTSSFLEALQGGGLPGFRRKYRDVDLLLIDDVQFFAGKKATLVEFLHTTDKLLREGRQLAFAADRSPSELSNLGPELVTRFSAGLVCALEPLDLATRHGVLRQLAAKYHQQFGAETPPEVLDFVADSLTGDARLLSGALNRLYAVQMATGKPFSVRSAEKTLRDLIQARYGMGRRAVRLADIERAVCNVCGLDAQLLQSNKRTKAISHPRMLAMWLARKHTRSAFVDIGDYFGRRSHATVISAQNKVKHWIEDGAVIRLPQGDCCVNDLVRQIERELRAGA